MFFIKHKRYLPVYLGLASILIAWAMLGMSFIDNETCEVIEEAETRELKTVALPTEPPRTLINEPILFSDVNYGVFYDIDVSKEFIAKLDSFITQLTDAVATGDYTDGAKDSMQREIARLSSIKTAVESDIKHYVAWENEYYYATKVWEYFMQRGYNEAVTSAILGNMMVETAGGTLNLRPDVYSPSGNYYGLCQWSIHYYPGTKDLPFEHQLDYLVGDMPYQFNTFGKCYNLGFDYEAFLTMTDPAQAAIAFAKSYERCNSAYYGIRADSAMVAYNYFNLNS